MNRREILRYTAWITGVAVSAPLASSILSGCSPQGNEKKTGDKASVIGELNFFSPEQFALVGLLADTILPSTDSPSATDVGAPKIVDEMFGLIYEKSFRATFRENWNHLEQYLDSRTFTDRNADTQVAILTELETGVEGNAQARSAFVELKQQLIAHYLTSDVVAKNFLNYMPIPGTYVPCISVDDVNNTAWAI